MAEQAVAPEGGSAPLPSRSRGCTDIVCIPLFILNWIVFVVVTFMGAGDGEPGKLVLPRDFRGDYCGLEAEGRAPGGLADSEKLLHLMNVSHTVEPAAMQLVCSSLSSNALFQTIGQSGGMTDAEYKEYQCACCLIPCGSCTGAFEKVDLTSASSARTAISDRMDELRSLGSSSLFESGSKNGLSFSPEDIMSEINVFFVPVCVATDCAVPAAPNFSGFREYVYSPAGDVAWAKAWEVLKTNALVSSAEPDIPSVIASSFTFQALPASRCPYSERYCVPMPGIEFEEIALPNVCVPKLATAVVAAIGDAAAGTLDGIGAGNLTAGAEEGVSAIADTVDSLVIVCVLSFVVGIVFLVLIRFLAGVAVWTALFLIFLAFVLSGFLCFVRSGQCANASLFDTGKQVATSGVDTAVSAATGQLNSEQLEGDGKTYVGFQTKTRSGRTCQAWSAQSAYVADDFAGPPASLSDVENHCRNPAEASTIWCYTTDPDKVWEECVPIGVLQPECAEGYMVADEWQRDVLKYSAYVFWVLAGLYLLIVWCLSGRIRLAIAVNKVASQFMIETPTVVLMPVFQVLIATMWILIWSAAASFLLSQVPQDYVPDTPYATYIEAAGTHSTTGKCNDKWPAGFVWKDELHELCDATQEVPKCWRCGLPRYVISEKFAVSFFSFLWSNAFIIAMGQLVLAYCCASWFFKNRVSPMRSLCVGIRYHIGTVAFGSFIIAVIQFIRAIMKYLEQQSKAQKNKVMVIILKAAQCCIWCFEKSVKFLNKNAYIQTAIKATNFCTSAKNAFMLIVSNAVRFSVVATVASALQLFGWIFVAAATAGLGYLILQAMHPESPPLFPVLSYVAVGYLVGKVFMAVFAMAIDTCLQCFLVVEQDHPEAADCVPGPLRRLLDAKDNHGKANAGVSQVGPETQ